MGQFDKSFRILVIDPDAAFCAELGRLSDIGIAITFSDMISTGAIHAHIAQRDVIIVSVETQAGLNVVAEICSQPDAPAVIAVGGAGFDGKPLEHVLLLAELRGAAAALPKPIEAAELAMVATSIRMGAFRRDCSHQSEPKLSAKTDRLAG